MEGEAKVSPFSFRHASYRWHDEKKYIPWLAEAAHFFQLPASRCCRLGLVP
jgi:hypothetical protein